jgi:hypothetical protein
MVGKNENRFSDRAASHVLIAFAEEYVIEDRVPGIVDADE